MKIVFFSVIVPVYNVEKYINECIDSILAQTFIEFELILVDDGSVDESGVICDKYAEKDARIKVIHKENGGPVSARKTGLSITQGDYIISVDSDDYIDKDLFQNLVDIINLYQPDIVSYNFIRVDGKKKTIIPKTFAEGLYTGNNLAQIRRRFIYDNAAAFYKFGILPGVVIKAFKRELYEKYQIAVPDTIKCGDDFAVSVPAILDAEKIYISNVDGYFYRYNDTSITNSYDKNAVADLKNLIDYFDKVLDAQDNTLKKQISAYLINRIHNMLVSTCRSVKTYQKYQDFTRQLDDCLIERTKVHQYTFHDAKSFLIPFAIKHKLWKLFWWFYHKS